MLSGLTGWHLLAILAIVVLIFGATRLPGLAKGLGQSIKIFRNEIKPAEGDKPATDGPAAGKGDGTAESKADTPAESTSDKPAA
jgi:sec-independent protein translocase protein TatA